MLFFFWSIACLFTENDLCVSRIAITILLSLTTCGFQFSRYLNLFPLGFYSPINDSLFGYN